MPVAWLILLGTYEHHDEIFLQRTKELYRSHAVEILDHAVVIEDRQFAGGEAHCHEIVVLLLACMMRISLGFLICHTHGSSRAMMTVSDIERGHLGKLARYGVDVLAVIDDPELMTEPILRCHEVIPGAV